MWEKLLFNLAIGYASKRIPAVGKVAAVYQEYGEPMIRAHRFYERNRKSGMSNAEALATAARDAGVPVKKLLNVIAHSSPEIGVELMSSVLAESKYSPDAPLTKFMGAK